MILCFDENLQTGIGAFILTGRANRSVRELMIFVLQRLPEIQQVGGKYRAPFIAIVPDRGRVDVVQG